MARAPLPPITYPPELPISERRDELAATIEANQVVVVAGETGSGKSTQLPKICLDLGRGDETLIAHTQPRRIAARAVAERVAEELGTDVGGAIGYAVRFTDKVGPDTRVKLMTDGILLAEIQRDRMLSRYDTIIIDEAHERSLNIDFLLGYLRQLLPRRPDLKVIITSATIDTDRFSKHFDDALVVEVSGRTYPVDFRYRPLDPGEGGDDAATEPSSEARDQTQGICDAARELTAEGPGDILVFCSGEREIRDAVDALTELDLRDTEIVPLYARLSSAEQHRVFERHSGRRIVVATNVAETSLTVPGIRYVIDPGTARISRYSRRTKVQRLPIEAISQASANQRAGRCGRLGPGICIRLFSEEDFEGREPFTEPEIQRTNLASVILQMASIGLGDIEGFPFVEPPDSRNIRDGIALLEELGAVRPGKEGTRKWLTGIGRKLAKLPLDPRLGRILLAADEHDCLREAEVIVAGLSIQDPRERPQEKRQAADEQHARFADSGSDFLAYLHLWEYLRTERRAGSSSRFRRLCKREFLNYPRVREWQDISSQLRRVDDELKLRRNKRPAEPEQIHRALLAGLLSQIGTTEGLPQPKERGPRKGRRPLTEFRGARNARFAIAPGSALFANPPRWIVAAELLETNRLWARTVTGIDPEWIEDAAGDLVKRSFGDPWWDIDAGAALNHESVTLFGLPVVGRRTIQWSRVDPADARDLFIRHALMDAEWDDHHAAIHGELIDHNADRIEEAQALEARLRRGDLVIGVEELVEWYDARLPQDVTDAASFGAWLKKARNDDPDTLRLTLDDLLRVDPDSLDDGGFPDVWQVDGLDLALTYEVAPDDSADGLTVDIPAAALGSLAAGTFDWLVPGLRHELAVALVRTLPKSLRKPLVPIPQTVDAIIDRLGPERGPLLTILADELTTVGVHRIAADDFDPSRLPSHLRPSYRVLADDGSLLATGTDLDALADLLRDEIRSSLTAGSHELTRTGLDRWDERLPDPIPRVVETSGPGGTVEAYPALVDEGESVGLALQATEIEQDDAMWAGTRRLLVLNRPSVSKVLRALLTNPVKLALVQSPYPTPTAWFDDCLQCAIDQLLLAAGGPAWDAAGFERLLSRVRADLPDLVAEIGQLSADILECASAANGRLHDIDAPRLAPAVEDMTFQIQQLVHPGFLTAIGAERLPDVRRYVRGIDRRLDRVAENPRRDTEQMVRVRTLEHELGRLVERHGVTPALEDIGWAIQELRISFFAQGLGAKGQVSEKRIRRQLAQQ